MMDDQPAARPDTGEAVAGDPGASTVAEPEPSAAPVQAVPSPDQGDGRPAEGDGEDETDEPGKRRSFWRELPVLIVVALVIALLIKNFLVQAFYIPSPSMEHTLNVGDKVLVNKLVYDVRSIKPGDVVVFNGVGSWDAAPPPASRGGNLLTRFYDDALRPLLQNIAGLFGTAPGQQDYIKRVIGVPGDHVACCTNGQVTVNGVPLAESSYLFPGDAPSMSRFSITVPAGRLWVMGDHRYVSYDSRGHMQDPGDGTIPESSVVGRAFLIVWPPSRWRLLSIPGTFTQPGVAHPPAAALAARSVAMPLSGPAVPGAALVPVAARPTVNYLPLELGFSVAVPLTWLQRRARRPRSRGRAR